MNVFNNINQDTQLGSERCKTTVAFNVFVQKLTMEIYLHRMFKPEVNIITI